MHATPVLRLFTEYQSSNTFVAMRGGYNSGCKTLAPLRGPTSYREKARPEQPPPGAPRSPKSTHTI